MEQNSFETQEPAAIPTTQKAPVGPIVGTVIIVALLAFGALYFWGDKLNNDTGAAPYTLDSEQAAALQKEGWMPASSGSDEAADIATELEAFDTQSLEENVQSDLGVVDSGL